MLKLFLILFCFMPLLTIAQSDFAKSKDPDNGSIIFKGSCTFGDLLGEPDFVWLKEGSAKYIPDSASVAFLKNQLRNYQLLLFMGTWCEDSHFLVPRIYKLLVNLDFPMEQLIIYGVDREKHTLTGEEEHYKLEKVPTLILLRDQIETGRIVEVVKHSLEQDLKKLIEQDLKP